MTGQQKYNHSNSKNLDYHLKQNKRIEDSKLFGTLFFFFFISVGIVGIYLSIFSANKQSRTLQLPSYSSKNTKEIPPAARAPKFTITGELETAETLFFTISPFDQKAVYIVDFGDGNYKTAVSNEITHQYTRTGLFEASVTRTKNGVTEPLFTKTVNIGHPIVRRGHNYDYND